MVYRLFNICMRSAPASFARKTRKKIGPPVLQANRRLAFWGGKEGALKDFMVHVLTFVRQEVRIHCSWWQKNDQNRDTHSFHYLFIMSSAPASFVRKTRKKIPLVLHANRRLAFCGGKKGSLKDFMVHVLTFVRQGVRIHCSWWQKNDQNRDTHSFHYELRKRAECSRRQRKTFNDI